MHATILDEYRRRIERLRSYMRVRGWKRSDLSRESGVNWTTIRGIDGPDFSPHVKILAKLEAVIPADWQPPVEEAA